MNAFLGVLIVIFVFAVLVSRAEFRTELRNLFNRRTLRGALAFRISSLIWLTTYVAVSYVILVASAPYTDIAAVFLFLLAITIMMGRVLVEECFGYMAIRSRRHARRPKPAAADDGSLDSPSAIRHAIDDSRDGVIES